LKYVYVASPAVTQEGLDRLRQSINTLQSVTLGGRPVPILEATRNPRDGILRYGGAVRRARLDLLEGREPPPLRLDGWVNADGKPLRLEDLKGKVVLIDFWGVCCRPCVDAMPALEDMQKEHAARGLVILGIHGTTEGEKMAEFVKARKLTLPMA